MRRSVSCLLLLLAPMATEVEVPVRLPVEGQPVYFEKLLALDEDLQVSFACRGPK